MSQVFKDEPSPPREDQAGQARSVHRSRLALVTLCIYWPAIFIISHIPKQYVPKDVDVSGKTLHMVAYFVLTVLVFLNAGLLGQTLLRSKKTYLLIGVIAAYAAVDEWLQVYIEGRHGSSVDWAIDVAACVLCVALLAIRGKCCSWGCNQLGK